VTGIYSCTVVKARWVEKKIESGGVVVREWRTDYCLSIRRALYKYKDT
jgi:hypothetical protein